MSNAYFRIQEPTNEPYHSYAPGTPERASLKKRLKEMKSEVIQIPAIIGGKEVRTGNTEDVVMPHNHGHKLATVHLCGEKEVKMAVEAALEAQREWAALPWEERVAVFLKAADLVSGSWRDTMNAATMLGQSKTPHQGCGVLDCPSMVAAFMVSRQDPETRSAALRKTATRSSQGRAAHSRCASKAASTAIFTSFSPHRWTVASL